MRRVKRQEEPITATELKGFLDSSEKLREEHSTPALSSESMEMLKRDPAFDRSSVPTELSSREFAALVAAAHGYVPLGHRVHTVETLDRLANRGLVERGEASIVFPAFTTKVVIYSATAAGWELLEAYNSVPMVPR